MIMSIHNVNSKLPKQVFKNEMKVELFMPNMFATISPATAKNAVPSWHKMKVVKKDIALSFTVNLFSILYIIA